MERVVVAMSGGVDSSVAAALLKEEGYEVIGMTLNLRPGGEAEESKISQISKISEIPPRAGLQAAGARGCCSLSDVRDAFAVSRLLGIPHYTLNLRELFQERVIGNFLREYATGRTPNPCIRCNELIKFDELLSRARSMGAMALATGHYARIRYDGDSRRYQLLRGVDRRKDQSYVLYPVKQEQLQYTLFPLGSLRKEEVRAKAEALGLCVAEKPDSEELCFVPHGDYREFIETVPGFVHPPGPIYSTDGRYLGEHRGLPHYTIGQRRRLGLSSSTPLYVVDIRPEENTIIVGQESQLLSRSLIAKEINWISPPPPAGQEPESVAGNQKVSRDREEMQTGNKTPRSDRGRCDSIPAQAKIRYNAPSADAELIPLSPTTARVTFHHPQRAITPGQSVVFYHQEMVLGGGIIDEVER